MSIEVCGVVACFALVFGLIFGIAAIGRSRELARQRAFRVTCESLGLRQSGAKWLAQHHWVGTVDGRDLFIGYYGGGRNIYIASGIMVMMRTDLLPGGGWGANLSVDPPKLWGKGDGEEEVRRLLTPRVIEAARGIEDVNLYPMDNQIKGALWDVVIEDGWPGGWSGLGIRGTVPKTADATMIGDLIRRLSAVVDALPEPGDR